MPIPFKIGDIVVVRPGASSYSITTPGSRGVVKKLLQDEFYVEFTKITSTDNLDLTPNFWFNESEVYNFLLVSSYEDTLSKADKKYSKVILKIRQMNANRKEKGYAF